jgi:c-di-GMP-binding flagellar brake protein YcgR
MNLKSYCTYKGTNYAEGQSAKADLSFKPRDLSLGGYLALTIENGKKRSL